MSVITAYDVERARDGVLVVKPGDVITPLARDRAKDLGVRLQTGAPETQTRVRDVVVAIADPSRLPRASAKARPRSASAAEPRSGALYRRAAYGLDGRRGSVATIERPATMKRGRPVLAIVGAGHVGAATAIRLAETDLFDELRMIDVVDGLAAGLALDIWHGSGLRAFTTRVSGSTDLATVAGADIVVVTAGRPRKPGMSRTDLTVANSEIVRGIADAVRTHAPDSTVVVVTNPLEEMTELMCRTTGFPAERVVGMGGILDTTRFKSLAGEATNVRPDDVDAIVLGSHGAEMVIPLSRASANGTPLEDLLDAQTLASVVKRTRESGAEVTTLLRAGSAFASPGSAIARQVEAMIRGSNDVLPACVRSRGAYGTSDTRVGLPVRLGLEGVREIVSLPLREAEVRELRAAATAIDSRIRAMG